MKAPNLVLLTDFSPLSKVAMLYALKMAAPLGANFTILNIVRVDGIPKANLKTRQLEKTISQIAQEEGDNLVAELRAQVKGNYTLVFKPVKARTVSEMVRKYVSNNPTNMVVMGLQGASALKKIGRLGGTTVSVIDECPVPVLAIPAYAKYSNMKNMVYATDLKNVKKELDIVVEFAKIFGSFVHMIHVAPSIDKKIETAGLAVDEMVQKYAYDKIRFELILEEDITKAIGDYIQKTSADLLTTFTHKLSLEEKLFGKSVTRKLAYQGTTPLLAVKRK
ncbi:MAG TPA: universal stress protein [Cyclobacteriaceae bacterium]|nr:universal stress protein [Cyclobacteriaceae bacterium]